MGGGGGVSLTLVSVQRMNSVNKLQCLQRRVYLVTSRYQVVASY